MDDRRVRIDIRQHRLPGWVAPLMVLLALAMIPVALALALGLFALALGVGAARVLFPGSGAGTLGDDGSDPRRIGRGGRDDQAIDVEYEAKDHDEKS